MTTQSCPQCGLPNPKENPYCFCRLSTPRVRTIRWKIEKISKQGETQRARLRSEMKLAKRNLLDAEAELEWLEDHDDLDETWHLCWPGEFTNRLARLDGGSLRYA